MLSHACRWLPMPMRVLFDKVGVRTAGVRAGVFSPPLLSCLSRRFKNINIPRFAAYAELSTIIVSFTVIYCYS